MDIVIRFLSKLNTGLCILALTVLFFHLVLGKHFKAYENWFYFDRFLHFFGSLVFSLFTYNLLYNFYPFTFPKFYTVIFIFTLGLSLGTLLEIVEFARDTLWKAKDQLGLRDTMYDMIFNVFGCAFSAIIAAFIF